MPVVRDAALRAFFRHRAVRRLVALRRGIDVSHLAVTDEVPNGPVQRDEALMLHGLVRVLRPTTVVEVGFYRGHSALNFLEALDEDARLYSFDIGPKAQRAAAERFGGDERFTFRLKSQAEIEPADVEGRTVDFVFVDASHDLALNRATFERLLPMLAPSAVVAVHDTGTMPRALIPPGHWWHTVPDGWIGDEREVMPGERAFVNWVLAEHPEFAQIHLHSRRTLRCGVTLLQRAGALPTNGGAAATAT